VRDVMYDEDRLHEQMIEHRLSGLRNGAIALPLQLDDRSTPDAHWAIVAQLALAFALLGAKMRTLKSPACGEKPFLQRTHYLFKDHQPDGTRRIPDLMLNLHQPDGKGVYRI
jgi:hypothetical protein